MAGAVDARPRLASDHYRVFEVRSSRDPPVWAPHKISLWDTRLCALGRDIDTVAMTISVPLEKLERLRDTLHEWSPRSCVRGGVALSDRSVVAFV